MASLSRRRLVGQLSLGKFEAFIGCLRRDHLQSDPPGDGRKLAIAKDDSLLGIHRSIIINRHHPGEHNLKFANPNIVFVCLGAMLLWFGWLGFDG